MLVRPPSRKSAHARGFSLIELMVVVMLIGILSAIALPSMLQGQIDRHVYGDAVAINDLIREARMRAIGRGGAVMVAMSTAAGSPGTFIAYEAVQPNPQTGGANSVPRSSCKAPTDWSLNTTAAGAAQSATQLDSVVLGAYEVSNGISTTIYSSSTGTLSAQATEYLCFTPLGRTYAVEGGAIQAGMFNNALPMTDAIQIQVARLSGASPVGIVRSVLIPPNGVARLLSSANLVAP
ncbi:MAG: prepilin-type N-terminal cleavage/methylation domain-containing protein [Polyangiaceae bacterium]